MRKSPLVLLFLALSPVVLRAQSVKEEVTFITDSKHLPDDAWQTELRDRANWQHFLAEHGTWYVEFNESNARPHRAFGRPIATVGATAEERARNFIASELNVFGVQVDELQLMSVAPGSKYRYVHFKQRHQGFEVLFSHVLVKLDQQDRVVEFGCDVFADPAFDSTPAIGTADAQTIAAQGLAGVQSESVEPELRMLPVPVWRSTEAHLVYEVMVHTQTDMPGHYWCLVDAHNGQLLYRQNRVVNEAPPGSAQVDLTGNVYEQNPWIPAVSLPLAHVLVNVNGTNYNTDMNGYLDTGVQGPVNATFTLQGDWSTVFTNGITPTFTTTLADGANAVTFDNDANIRERSAYYHVNIIHDHHKAWILGFTGMDFSLPTNVDVAGNCNAFYDGTSINFYLEGNNCQSYAQVGDVIYHEYGHGINDNFYQANGGSFNNGAMNEGYADFWGFSVTHNPILAAGSSLNNATDFIRRYDINKKVYPSDLIGEVHADGEIIAGAWWDTYLQLWNDMDHTLQLFAEAYPGLQATAANGAEGTAYRDVLIDVLQADDDDADITNGTPNGNAIVTAFAIHGITLISNATLQHTALETAPETDPIDVNATLLLSFPFTQYLQSVVLKYRLNNSTTWNDLLMTNIGGNDYQGQIPGQPQGTVVAYYVGVQDIFQQVSAVLPIGADLAEPNIPYFILVGYALEETYDADNNTDFGVWHPGLNSDNATTGLWTLDIPVGSFTTDNIIVQTNAQHTPGGEVCFLTGNAQPSDAVGTNDVDAGRTTLQCDPIDLSALDEPTISFWRWYVNDPPTGANPGMDWWQVDITNDGANWVRVENTRTSDKSWRRFAFRVEDYLSSTNSVQLRFVASDSTHLGEYLDGGSLIEAAVDDIQLWDKAGNIGIVEVGNGMITNVFPDPANDFVNVTVDPGNAQNTRLLVIDATGRTVIDRVVKNNGTVTERIDTHALAPGAYVLRALWEGGRVERRFNIVR